jgi:type IX secretion system PorP/SprF family membrane protein
MTHFFKLYGSGLLPVLLLSASFLPAQETNFTQFFNLRTALNPAFVSVPTGVELGLGYRRQWAALQGGLSGAFAGVAVRHCGTTLAYGVTVSQLGENVFGYHVREGSFQLGVFVNTSATSSLHFGVQATAGQRGIDANRQVFSGQLDPVFGIVRDNSTFVSVEKESVRTFALGSGLVWRGEMHIGSMQAPCSAGFAMHNIGGSRDISFQNIQTILQPRWIAHASMAFPVAEAFSSDAAMYVSPMFRIDLQQALRQTYTGCIFQFKTAYIGLIYQHAHNPVNIRNTNTLSVAPGVEMPWGRSNHVTLGYSFDMPLSGLGATATAGSHELSAKFSFDDTCLLGTDSGRGHKKGGIFGGGSRRGKTKCYQFGGKSFLGFLN